MSRWIASACVFLGVVACGPHDEHSRDAGAMEPDASMVMDAGDDAGSSIVMAGDGGDIIGPTQGDFADYHNWLSFDGGSDPADGIAIAGQRTLYLNHAPPDGSTSFPVGTIIVKDIETDAGAAQTFAMYKRGGDYNASGAPGWEWLEVSQDSGGGTIIVWSGTAPPKNMTYSGLLSCNACHSETKSTNDSVQGTAIQLSSF